MNGFSLDISSIFDTTWVYWTCYSFLTSVIFSYSLVLLVFLNPIFVSAIIFWTSLNCYRSDSFCLSSDDSSLYSWLLSLIISKWCCDVSESKLLLIFSYLLMLMEISSSFRCLDCEPIDFLILIYSRSFLMRNIKFGSVNKLSVFYWVGNCWWLLGLIKRLVS